MTLQTRNSLLRRVLQYGALAATLPLAVGFSQAGTISTPSLDAVFGEANFGTSPIAIHWLAPGASIVDPSLNAVKSFDTLLGLSFKSTEASPRINVFFVDQINWCNGNAGSNFKGCSIINSNVVAVESSFASGTSGYLDIAHELVHALGLDHVSGANLMNPVLGSATLTANQVASILANDKVQTALDGSRFIEIRPFAVLSAVPEPATYGLMFAGLILVGAAVRRARKQ